MADHDVDLFVIGAGSGGVRAARIAASHGARVMIAEEYRVGGTCVIRGCVPKKLLVYASRFADDFEDAAGYGWTVPEPTFHWPTLIANKDREIARLEAAYTTTLERYKVALVKSRAVIEDAHTVRLATGARVRAETILIATGAAPYHGARIAGLEHVISSNEAFHLDRTAQAHPDPGRRLYRRRVRRHLQRARLRGDAGLSRREHPARLRRRRARASARRDGDARHQDHHQADRRGRREGRARLRRRALRQRAGDGRPGDVRDRPQAERARPRPRSRRRQARRDRRHRGRRLLADHVSPTSTPSATSPTASI